MSCDLQPDPSDPSDEPDEVDAPTLILNCIRAANQKFFRDRAGVPSVCLPADPERKIWPIRSERVEAWVSHLVEAKAGFVPKAAQVREVLRVCEGEAHLQPRLDGDDQQLWEAIDNEPVLLVLLDFMKGKKPYQSYTHALLKDLNIHAPSLKVWTDSNQWPKITQVLSRKLKTHSQTLRQAGLRVQLSRTREGSHVELRWLDGDASDAVERPHFQEASPESSGNCSTGEPCDANDPIYQQAISAIAAVRTHSN